MEPFAATLTKLDADLLCGMTDAGLVNAHRIAALDASGNAKITTVAPFATSLTKLGATFGCGIGDAGLLLAEA